LAESQTQLQVSTKSFAEPLEQLKVELAASKEREQIVSKAVLEAREQIAQLNKLLVEREFQIASLQEAPKVKEQVEQVPVSAPGAAAELKASRAALATPDRAISTSRHSSLLKKVSVIQGLIGKRKNLSDRLRAKKPHVAISLQPLKTKHGVSLDQVRAILSPSRNSNSVLSEKDVGRVEGSLYQIERILKEDIGVIKRLLG
jgi:hypothetical protein